MKKEKSLLKKKSQINYEGVASSYKKISNVNYSQNFSSFVDLAIELRLEEEDGEAKKEICDLKYMIKSNNGFFDISLLNDKLDKQEKVETSEPDPIGIVSLCFIDETYSIHILDFKTEKITHYKRSQPIPSLYQKAASNILLIPPDAVGILVFEDGDMKTLHSNGKTSIIA